MTDGTDQAQRLPAALGEGYFRVDELTLEQRVAMSAAHAAQLQFFDLTQRPAGSWRELFDNDAALVMARIISIDARTLEQQFAHDLAAAAPAQRLAIHTMTLAGWLDLWMKSLHGHQDPAARRLLERMEQMVELQLRDVLRDTLLHGASAATGDTAGELQQRRLLRLDARWRASDRAQPGLQRNAQEVLRASLHTFVSAIEQLQALARELLPACLGSQSHEAAAGLLLAFLQLYQLTQGEINRFTERHTQFYYERCLRMKVRSAIADSVHLVCSREPRFAHDVVIARGTQFAAGKDAGGQPIEFIAQEDLLVTEARVAALHTLHFERDPLISPEREFGFVTRAKVNDIAPVAGGASRDYPLFGSGTTDRDARLGIAVAAPVLLLKEGTREIRFSFVVTHTDQQDANIAAALLQAADAGGDKQAALCRLFERYLEQDAALVGDGAAAHIAGEIAAGVGSQPLAAAACYWQFITALVARSESPAEFQLRLGRVFSRWLLSTEIEFEAQQLAGIRAAADRLLGERVQRDFGPQDPLGVIFGTEPPQRALVFDLIFRDLFSVHLTTADGWHTVTDAYVGMSSDQVPQLIVRLQREAPAIVASSHDVHGAAWPAGQPVARIELKPQARMYSYSLLSQLLLSEIRIAVRVQGVRDLVLYNNLGRLDATRTLYPFGPMPTLASYLILGMPEAAAKHLTAVQLHFEWSGLPRGRGGFAEYYAGYDREPRTEDFTVDLAVLNDGVWQPHASRETQLFAADATGTVTATSHIALDAAFVRKYYKPELMEAFDYSSVTRNGFFRLQLSGPEHVFGHAAYPTLLTRVVSDNARLKRSLAMPNPPYTPTLERVVLDYDAEISISLAQDAGAPLPQVRVLHLHPFGMEEIYQIRRAALPTALPAHAHFGNLLIGIEAQQLHGPLTLLFRLRDEAPVSISESGLPLSFAYLAHDRWCEMTSAQLLSDSTNGFLTSGIVTLDIPAAIRADNCVMPAGLFWLRVAVDHGFDSFAGLISVHAQALSAQRRECGAEVNTIADGIIKQPVRSIPGLQLVTQVGASFGLRPLEDASQLRTRTGERLRHKQRALTAWDYERLVLDRFNGITKVKCFRVPAERDAQYAGRILIVVIPANPATAATLHDPLLGRRVNAIELKRIEEYLLARSSPFVKLTVRNAAYEYLQVRCTVQLARGVPPGMSIRRINQCIVEHLSPWHHGGYQARFDWTARGDDVEAWIRTLDCVDAVSGLSLLHITNGARSHYTLADTARAQAHASGVSIQPRSPYSILIPTSQHLIATSSVGSDVPPQVTGVASLAIGNTFIVGGNS